MQEHTDWLLSEPTGREWFDWRDVVVYDCEANGLLDRPDYRMHCAWYYDMRSREYHSFRPDQIREHIAFLNGRVVVAHNGLGYDFLALRMVAAELGVEYAPLLEVDTLVLVRMLWPVDDLIEPDARLWKKGLLPGNLMKAQSIEAWGYRMGEMKGDYSDAKKAEGKALGITDYSELMEFVWGTFNEPMFTYNKQDVTVLLKLLLKIFRRLGWFQPEDYTGYSFPAAPVETEHLMQAICLQQERRGMGFNHVKAIKLSEELANKRTALEATVASAFHPWFQPKGDTKKGSIATARVRRRLTNLPKITIRRFSDKTGKELASEFDHPWATTEAGAAFVPITYTEFALSNRHHLAHRLVAVYGWKPKAFGGAKGDDPVVDEATISAIDDKVLAPELKKAILDYYVIDKTYKTLAEGKNAWLRLYDEDTGTIHGRCNPLGTITARASHDKPNLGNIPSVELDEEKDASGKVISSTVIGGVEGGFGEECRELFGPASPFDTQTGTDVHALEFFMLAHYLTPFDGGAFGERLLAPGADIHRENATVMGLKRSHAKTTGLKTLYGSGAGAIGFDVWTDDDDVAYWADAPGVKNWIRWNQQRLGIAFKMPTKQERAYYGKGKVYQNKLLDAIPGLKEFRKDVTDRAEANGYLIALDGRKISVRKAFAALNALLQCSGSITCKVWIITLRRMLMEQGLMPSILDPRGKLIEARDWNQIAWVHDETQNEHMKALGNTIGDTAERAIKHASERLKLRYTLSTDYKVGSNWAECH